MQLIPRYLYENKVTLVSNDIGFIVEYRPVYSRQLKVYMALTIKYNLECSTLIKNP